jgi:N-acetylglucosaminyldiphosphoundecaprenol N-acetyl-beta-D-mannosaminyltransferase
MKNGKKVLRFLGVGFWTGDVNELLLDADQHGGLFTVPSAPSLAEMRRDPMLMRAYRRSDWAVVDGGYVALILRFVFRRSVPRISGLQILQKLLGAGAERVIPIEKRKLLWVMPNEDEAGRVGSLAEELGLCAEMQRTYLAPFYAEDEEYQDQRLLELVREFRPDWIILGIGGGRQEKLGLCVREMLAKDSCGEGFSSPVILCTGGAIAFLTGGQVRIPKWADRLYLGWLLRICHDPKRFLGRYVTAAWSFPLALWQHRVGLFDHSPRIEGG